MAPPTVAPKKSGGAWFTKLPPLGKAGVVVGGLAVLVIGYKHFKGTSSTTAATTAGGCPPGYQSDGAGGCVSASAMSAGTGGGYGGGAGGGGDTGLGQSILSALNQLSSTLATSPNPSINTPGDSTGTAPTTSASTGTAPISAAAPPAPDTTAFKTTGGYAPGPSTPNFNFTTIFTNPSTGQTYYGLGNQGSVTAARSAGYKIATAKDIGVPGGTTKAQYAYK